MKAANTNEGTATNNIAIIFNAISGSLPLLYPAKIPNVNPIIVPNRNPNPDTKNVHLSGEAKWCGIVASGFA